MRSARGCWTEKFVNFAIVNLILRLLRLSLDAMLFSRMGPIVRERLGRRPSLSQKPTKTEPGSVLGLESEL